MLRARSCSPRCGTGSARRSRRAAAGRGHARGLDVLGRSREVAQREGYVRPEISEGFDLEIAAAGIPVVERMMPREQFIPNDVRLDDATRG